MMLFMLSFIVGQIYLPNLHWYRSNNRPQEQSYSGPYTVQILDWSQVVSIIFIFI